MNCNAALMRIYLRYANSPISHGNIPHLDAEIFRLQSISPRDVTLGPEERLDYESIFNPLCSAMLNGWMDENLEKLTHRPYSECYDAILRLGFIQTVFAIALFKYRIPISKRFERFGREFERLDVEGERKRLYDLAQHDSTV